MNDMNGRPNSFYLYCTLILQGHIKWMKLSHCCGSALYLPWGKLFSKDSMCLTSFGIDPVRTWHAQKYHACYEFTAARQRMCDAAWRTIDMKRDRVALVNHNRQWINICPLTKPFMKSKSNWYGYSKRH